ncbi:MAG: hypothetical protein LBH36_02345 [Candidatus Nomurabacteria bacterium]|nr:hypothetical protein [Candidatus Nomurabacteria bacterium]
MAGPEKRTVKLLIDIKTTDLSAGNVQYFNVSKPLKLCQTWSWGGLLAAPVGLFGLMADVAGSPNDCRQGDCEAASHSKTDHDKDRCQADIRH